MKSAEVQQFGQRIKAAKAVPGEVLVLLAIQTPSLNPTQVDLLATLGGLVASVNLNAPAAQNRAISQALALVADRMTGPVGTTLAQLADALEDGRITSAELLELASGQVTGPAGEMVMSLARILEDNKVDRNDVGPALSMAFALTALVRR